MAQKNDGIINWVEPKNLGFLPKDIEEDSLSVIIRLLIMKVKEEHASMQYRKELKHYAPEIIEIMKFAKSGGYKGIKVNDTQYKNAYYKLIDNMQKTDYSSSPNKNSDNESNEFPEIKIQGNGIVEDLSFLNEGS